MRLIDADALTFTHDYVTADGEPCITKAVIDNAPTIDAYGEGYKQGRFDAEADMDYIVRCKDCKHWKELENGTGSCGRSGGVWWFGIDADYFCSFGERRKDDE